MFETTDELLKQILLGKDSSLELLSFSGSPGDRKEWEGVRVGSGYMRLSDLLTKILTRRNL